VARVGSVVGAWWNGPGSGRTNGEYLREHLQYVNEDDAVFRGLVTTAEVVR
jgi:hypothetical protein